MKANVGSVDRIVRVVVGAALLALFFVVDAPLRYIGLVGLVPLATAAFNWCPLYTLLGINTCRTSG